MDLLLDAQVFLWWDKQDPAPQGQPQAMPADPANSVFVGAASPWEFAVRRRLGKLELHGSPVTAIAANGFHQLPVRGTAAESAGDPPWRHNDRFDRLSVAQARRLTIHTVTADRTIRAFGCIAQLWAG